MEVPKFLIADNSSLDEEIFVLHTEYPRFLLKWPTTIYFGWKNLHKKTKRVRTNHPRFDRKCFTIL